MNISGRSFTFRRQKRTFHVLRRYRVTITLFIRPRQKERPKNVVTYANGINQHVFNMIYWVAPGERFQH